MYRLGQCREAREGGGEGQLSQRSPCDENISDQFPLLLRLPLERIEDRMAKILSGDHQLGQTHWSNTCKDGQNMWVQKRLLGGGPIPDESPDDTVEAEVDYKAGIGKTNQRGLRVMDSGRFLINLMPLVCHQVIKYFLPSPLTLLGMWCLIPSACREMSQRSCRMEFHCPHSCTQRTFRQNVAILRKGNL